VKGTSELGGLFEHARQQVARSGEPLASRMRPRALDDFVGQEHIIGPGRLLRRAIQADQLSSLIFWGPPGTGKTTLASIIAHSTSSHFLVINAVLAGVADIRDAIRIARERQAMYGQRTILFVDEVHRFNKAQQDALLPHVENGTVILIGATTENPYFEVIKALVSRSRIFQLKRLGPPEIKQLLQRALADNDRGYGLRNIEIAIEALDHLADVANGDARSALNALELAVETTPADPAGVIRIGRDVAEESIQRRAVLYDKDGDAHYDTISAFIKSLRGSDPDAAVYWMARMVEAGEEPRFIFRRMVVFAGEDIGLADPTALTYVMSAAQAFEYVGMPEGRYHLAAACLYLATAPKSNSAMAFFAAIEAVERERDNEVPVHLRDASRDKDGFGHGEGYKYPHSYRDHWVAQQYLPDKLLGHRFYAPDGQGAESAIKARIELLREAQAAALAEQDAPWRPETLATGPAAAGPTAREQWLSRTHAGDGQRLLQLRQRLLDAAAIARHELVVDLCCGTGFLTWEAVRRTPEGGVVAVDLSEAALAEAAHVAASLPALHRPAIIQGAATALPLKSCLADAALARDLLRQTADPAAALAAAWHILKPGGRLILYESLPEASPPLHRVLPADQLPWEVIAALDSLHAEFLARPPVKFQLDEGQTADLARQAQFINVRVQTERDERTLFFSRRQADTWLDRSVTGGDTLGQALARRLAPEMIARYQEWLAGVLPNRPIAYPVYALLITGRKPADA